MSNSTPDMSKLIALSKETSSEDRRILLREITDVFMDGIDTYSENEINLFGGVLGDVSAKLDSGVRERLSQSICAVAKAPHNLVNQLARDDINVAKPILENSPVLDDNDLVDIAKSQGQDYLRAIAQRTTVSEVVSDTLVEHGDEDVLVDLCENKGAQISRSTMETLVDKSQTSEKLQSPLLKRDGIPTDLLNEMYFFVSSSLQRVILQKFESIDDKEMQEAMALSAERVAKQIVDQEVMVSGAMQYIDRIEKINELNEGQLIKLLKNRQVNEFVVGFSRLTDMDLRTVRRIAFSESCEGLAIACRASHFEQSTFSSIVFLTGEVVTRDNNVVHKMVELYNQLPVQTAERTMRFWRVRRKTAA